MNYFKWLKSLNKGDNPLISFFRYISVEWFVDKNLELAKFVGNLLDEIHNNQRYTEEEIRTKILFENSEMKCIICRQIIIFNDLIILNCCGSAAHRIHIQVWLNKEDRCPYCRKKNVKLLSPKQDMIHENDQKKVIL